MNRDESYKASRRAVRENWRPGPGERSVAEGLLAAARTGSVEFETAYRNSRLDEDGARLLSLHITLVLAMEVVLRLRFPATRRNYMASVDVAALQRDVAAAADRRLFDAERCRMTLMPPARPSGARGLGVGLPPKTAADLYTVAACCNAVIDDSLRGRWVMSNWRKRFAIASKAATRRLGPARRR